VVADAGYGVDGRFRAGVSELGLEYAVGVQSSLRHTSNSSAAYVVELAITSASFALLDAQFLRPNQNCGFSSSRLKVPGTTGRFCSTKPQLACKLSLFTVMF
jgi:hypothetical protein